jgi:SPOR domain
MRVLLFCFFLFTCSELFAQDSSGVKVLMDAKTEQLLQKKLELDKTKPSIQGYRVQLYYGGNRAEALELKSKFASLYPEIETYLIYQQPYFRLRAGNYRTRIEAYKLFRKVEKEFPSVFIVNDEIAFP